MTATDWRSYEAYADQLMARHQIPGAAVAVAVDGERVYTHGFGYRDCELGLPVTDQTLFGIGSITKSFTAVAIMQLQEQGKLSVADPALKYLPEFRFGKGAEQAMTLHHFLTHTTGVPPLASINAAIVRSLLTDTAGMPKEAVEKLKALEPIDTREQLMAFIAKLDVAPLGAPGLFFSYCNDCFALLGLVIERLSGEKYEDYIVRHILQPLGMTQSTFELAPILKSDNAAKLYVQKHVKGRDVVEASPQWWECPAMSASGFLRSNTSDMLRYMEIYRTGGVSNGVRILSERSIAQMTTPYAAIPSGLYYGYGLTVHPNYRGVSLVEHGGNVKGVSAYVTCVPEKGITGVALTNVSTAPGGALLLGAVNTLLGERPTTPRFRYNDYACPPERLSLYAGEYRSDEGATIKVTVKGNGLVCTTPEGVRISARPVGRDRFAARRKGQDTLVHFLIDTKGEAYAMEYGFRIIRKAKTE